MRFCFEVSRGLDSCAAGTPEISHPWEISTRPFFAPALPGLREKLDAPQHNRRAPGSSELLQRLKHVVGGGSIADSSLGKTRAEAATSVNSPSQVSRRAVRLYRGASSFLRSPGGAGAKSRRVEISHGWEISGVPAVQMHGSPTSPTTHQKPEAKHAQR